MPIKDILRSIPLFKNLDNADLDLIASYLHKERYPKGSFVFREGEVGDTMYLVESGRLAVVGQEATDTIAIMGPGSFVGEISLLLAQPRTANLQVMIDAELWVLQKRDFEQLISTQPSIALEMMRELSQRLVTTTRRKRRPQPRKITAFWGDNALELARALYSQFRAAVGLLPLPGSKVRGDVTLSGGVMFLAGHDLTEASLAERLSHQIQVFKHIVLVLPEQPDDLARKAFDLADTVVSIGRPPVWLTATDHDKKVWVFPGPEVDLTAIARRLTNRSVGLALSSGGSRGLAHIGVLKVLLEEKIPIDMVAGTSAGAWFGTFFAAGWDKARYERFIEEIKTVTKVSNWDFNIPPWTGIAKGRKARDRVIAASINHRNFEDLGIPMCMVAADILTGEEVIFDSGPLADAIRASLSVPVLADPWFYQGHYLVDGGIVNPLPASVLRERGADIVIASSVIQPMGDSYGGRMDRMPNILQIVFNMFSAMEAEVVAKQLPLIDVLIQHHVSAKHTLDFEQVNEVVNLGEQTARQMLPAIKKAIEHPPE
ncbi:MAG: patatin-like phospholipase family protein, partial [Chloroflexota bacterium]